MGGEEFFIDLLFYHLKLRCYVVIELKAGKFKPEHLGQLGFYLTAVDRQVKHAQDNPSIGLLLCKSKNKVVAEYALGDKSQPMPRFERKSQNRVARLFITPVADGGLGYEHLGNWSQRDHNRAIDVDLLCANLAVRGYSPAHISAALQKLEVAVDVTGITPYQANRCTYRLLSLHGYLDQGCGTGSFAYGKSSNKEGAHDWWLSIGWAAVQEYSGKLLKRRWDY